MTPTTEQLAAVRQAAERLYDWTLQRGHPDKGRFGINPWNLDDPDIAYGKRDDAGMLLALHILATIPERPGDEITAEWLRECWGFEDNCHEDYIEQAWELRTKYGRIAVWNFNGEDWRLRDMDSFPLTTRHQVAQLMAALGIDPRHQPRRISRKTSPENNPINP